ncbi:MAG: DUF454 domain-containing protein [Anaerolineales bacterium]|nr:MAG: DUF454 domain-containing protein [Anaerolineales bacterium]
MDKATLRKIVLMIAGFLSIGLALFGIFIPILPTTPFLLLAAGCFVRSSPRLYSWLIHHKWFGDYIRHYRENRAITIQAKIVTLLLLWGMIGYTAFGIVTAWWLRILLGIIAGGVTWHILSLRTLTHLMVKGESDTVV